MSKTKDKQGALGEGATKSNPYMDAWEPWRKLWMGAVSGEAAQAPWAQAFEAWQAAARGIPGLGLFGGGPASGGGMESKPR